MLNGELSRKLVWFEARSPSPRNPRGVGERGHFGLSGARLRFPKLPLKLGEGDN